MKRRRWLLLSAILGAGVLGHHCFHRPVHPHFPTSPSLSRPWIEPLSEMGKVAATTPAESHAFEQFQRTSSAVSITAQAIQARWAVVDTGQEDCFDNRGPIDCPAPGEPFAGQDAQFGGVKFAYRISADGLTVLDEVTLLTWTRNLTLDVTISGRRRRLTHAEAIEVAEQLNARRYGGFDDWRLPSIKELYSLINFSGDCEARRPYLDAKVFEFQFGDAGNGGLAVASDARPARPIDAQFWSATEYLGRTFGDNPTAFGVNFADGRIKGYPTGPGDDGVPPPARNFARYVRGPLYGINDFRDNGDGTVTDRATGLMWAKADSGTGKTWEEALLYAEQLELAGHDDWRLPDAKELQTIVSYQRAPEALDPAARGPAIDPVFEVSDEDAYYWSSTTHLEAHLPGEPSGTFAVCFCFGRAVGTMRGRRMDVHGAGAQRSDPKVGGREGFGRAFPRGFGPQGDELRGRNLARGVRNAESRPRGSESNR